MEQKKQTKAEVEKKVKAWETVNSVLIATQAEIVKAINDKITEKETEKFALQEKLNREGGGTSDENAEFLYTVGYIEGLKYVLNKGMLK